MTLEERANAIAAHRNGLVQGSHLHKAITAFAVKMMKEVIEDCAKVADDEAAAFKRANDQPTAETCGNVATAIRSLAERNP